MIYTPEVVPFVTSGLYLFWQKMIGAQKKRDEKNFRNQKRESTHSAVFAVDKLRVYQKGSCISLNGYADWFQTL